jgi:hypothetical protein
MLSNKTAKVFPMILRNSNMVMLLRCTGSHFAFELPVANKLCPNTTNTSLTAFNSSQLLDEELFVRALVSGLWGAMLKFALH